MIALLLAAALVSPEQLYAKAIAAMSDVPQPRYVTYNLQGAADGLQVDLMLQRGQVWLNVHGGSGSANWTLQHRTYDYASQITDNADNRRYLTQRSFFDPTWYGAYRALREGMFDSQDAAPPRPQQTAAPASDVTLKTIAVSSVIGPSVYAIDDRGDAHCSNGDPGRALHLTSRDRNSHHQLTDVIIDLHSMRFCMMRFAETSGFGFHGFLEQHYADVGGYWLQTDGLLDGTLRVFGISTHHGTWRYRLLDMQFPAALQAQTFLTSSPCGAPERR